VPTPRLPRDQIARRTAMVSDLDDASTRVRLSAASGSRPGHRLGTVVGRPGARCEAVTVDIRTVVDRHCWCASMERWGVSAQFRDAKQPRLGLYRT
jgi:hypothetical protein